MAILVQVIDAGGGVSEYALAGGDGVTVGDGASIALPEAAAAQVALAVGDGDSLALTVAGETVFVAGLITNLENESGGGVSFADGTAIATFGALLARTESAGDALQTGSDDAGLGLLADDGNIGDLFFVDDAAAGAAAVDPTAGAALDISEILDSFDTAAGADAQVLDAFLSDGGAGGGAQFADLWAETESAGAGIAPLDPLDESDAGLLHFDQYGHLI